MKVCNVCVRHSTPQGFCEFRAKNYLTQRRKGCEALCSFVLLSKHNSHRLHPARITTYYLLPTTYHKLLTTMSTTNPDAELFRKLYTDVRDYAKPHLRYARLDAVSKLSALLTFFILSLTTICLCACLLIFLTFQAAFFFASLWGSLGLAILTIIGI